MLGVLGAGLSLIGGIAKAASGAKVERQMRNALRNYTRQDLSNVFSGIGVSTLGSQLLREENARLASSNLLDFRKAGMRALGMVPSIYNTLNRGNTAAAADLDRQRQQIDQMFAQDEARIRAMQERREEQDLAGIGAQLNAARQDKFAGIGDIGSSFMALGMLGGDSFINNTLGLKGPVTSPMGGQTALTLPTMGASGVSLDPASSISIGGGIPGLGQTYNPQGMGGLSGFRFN